MVNRIAVALKPGFISSKPISMMTRRQLYSWAFQQLRQMIDYKAARAGVLVEFAARA